MAEILVTGTWKKDNIILIGMAGSGKSSIGRRLAMVLSRRFTDTDVLMESAAGIPLQKIIEERDYVGFRLLEEEVLLRLNLSGHVIATGGSCVYSTRGMQHLKQNGIVIFLNVPPSLLLERITNLDNRGLVRLPEQSFIDLYTERLPLYQKYADYIFSCDRMNEQEICDALVRILQNLT